MHWCGSRRTFPAVPGAATQNAADWPFIGREDELRGIAAELGQVDATGVVLVGAAAAVSMGAHAAASPKATVTISAAGFQRCGCRFASRLMDLFLPFWRGPVHGGRRSGTYERRAHPFTCVPDREKLVATWPVKATMTLPSVNTNPGSPVFP